MKDAASSTHSAHHARAETHMYGRLALMAALSFVSMLVLMYAMVDTFGDVYPNLNQAYMAALMTAPMVIIEVLLMSNMYPSKPVNLAIVIASVVLLAVSFLMIRAQTAIGDREFLGSMIPHHSGAILMCREANIADPEIKTLCGTIIESQRREIAQMKDLLDRR